MRETEKERQKRERLRQRDRERDIKIETERETYRERDIQRENESETEMMRAKTFFFFSDPELLKFSPAGRNFGLRRKQPFNQNDRDEQKPRFTETV